MASIRGYEYTIPDRIGDTIAHRHVNCYALGGKPDHKERLYITRKEKHLALYYCQHCGAKGKLRIGIQDPTEKGKVFKPKHLPEDYSYQIPDHAQAWLDKYEIDRDLARKYRLGYSGEKQALVIPIQRFKPGRDVGHILRCYSPSAHTRYLSSIEDKEALAGLYIESDVVFIVEDWLSTIKIAETGYSCVCLLGNTLSRKLLPELLDTEYSQYVVWLDNDSPLVKSKARGLAKELCSYGKQAVFSTACKEPKHYSVSNLSYLIQTGYK